MKTFLTVAIKKCQPPNCWPSCHFLKQGLQHKDLLAQGSVAFPLGQAKRGKAAFWSKLHVYKQLTSTYKKTIAMQLTFSQMFTASSLRHLHLLQIPPA